MIYRHGQKQTSPKSSTNNYSLREGLQMQVGHGLLELVVSLVVFDFHQV
jgi:hypothetical protein